MDMWMLLFICLLYPAVQGSEDQLDKRIDEECHTNYYVQPECIDHPDGYGCECGPGFHWNTKMCMSSAIDSRFEFKVQDDDPPRYTLLLGRAFPQLAEFTVAFWLNVTDPKHPGTVLSYKHGDKVNLMRFVSGPKLNFEIWGEKIETIAGLIPHEFVHIAWTWSSLTKRWQLYRNGVVADHGALRQKQTDIPSGGDFVLGQASLEGVKFDISNALQGDLSHFNMWDFILPPKEVSFLASSCTFQYCGNAVQWVEFRAGTRGSLRMRWPSGIFSPDSFPCFSDKDAGETCDKSCSLRIGAQCNEEISENILWRRQRAEQNVSVECPGFEPRGEVNENVTVIERYATRSCLLQTNDNDGIWHEPIIDDCITEDLLDLKIKFQQLDKGELDQTAVLKLSERLLNHTESHTYINPIDVATVIDLVAILVETQNHIPQVIETVQWDYKGKRYARAEVYPTFNQTVTFCEIVAKIVNNLLKARNEGGWNATSPAGIEGDSLMLVMHRFAQVIARSLIFHVVDMRAAVDKARVSQFHDNIEFSIITQFAYGVKGMHFPSSTDIRDHGAQREEGFIQLGRNPIKITNATDDDFTLVGISAFRFKNLARILPAHPVKSRSLQDWVNAPVMALYLHLQDSTFSGNLSSGILLHVPVLNNFNISNPACVSLVHKKKKRNWQWSGHQCSLRGYDGRSVTCSCLQPGVFTVTTDMYNDNWDKGDEPPELMNFVSYFGCAASATMCLVTCAVHIYLRTSSSTAALHRNLSVSVALSQLAFMFGIDRFNNPAVCQVFAILFHYTFLTNYLWVMNEAFNMYIVITYSAISKSDVTDSGSIVRYYIIGWAFPVVLVGAFVGTVDDYYAADMCWVSPEHIWLFLGPALGIIGITILVLIFAAKEHNENSYTNSEKTNKIITIQMKGLWIQIILITVCWSFAIISITMVDRILKYLYALFNCLQGAFFIVFFMLLHEEVRAWMKGRKKKKTMQWQGYDMNDDHSLQSDMSNIIMDNDGREAMGLERRARRPARQKTKTRIEASSDEASDHSDSEMISSV